MASATNKHARVVIVLLKLKIDKLARKQAKSWFLVASALPRFIEGAYAYANVRSFYRDLTRC